MAKSARASSKKFNNQRKAASVFAPTENARAERLSAKLLELAKQPKPESSDVNMNTEDNDLQVEITTRDDNDTAMEVDASTKTTKPRRSSRVIAKTNILVPISILVFAIGFFPYKPFLPGLAEYESLELGPPPSGPFDKLVFMVVDALRSDFVFSEKSGFEFTQSLIRDGSAVPFTANARSPTVTMPRIKSITTGSIPSFVDLILNFDEADTSSTLSAQDTWLAQLKARGMGKLLMFGDDTWLKLFPDTFDRTDGTTSFFVSDFTEVDNNVTRNIAGELENNDWGLMVLHYLGLDHIGHKSGPRSPNMVPKQQEMDGIVQTLFEAIESKNHLKSTLLVICGDHGMNDAGNHGASSPGETSPALLFISPKMKAISSGLSAPATPKDEFEYYSKVEQSDLAPTIAALLGFPVSKNNLGAFIPAFLPFWPSARDRVQILMRNAKQILGIVTAAFGDELFDPKSTTDPCLLEPTDINTLACQWRSISQKAHTVADARHVDAEWLSATSTWLRRAQDLMSAMASNYDIPKLLLGLALASVSMLLSISSTVSRGYNWNSDAVPLLLITLSYGIMMFASSFVEEEHHFWYWSCTLWLAYLGSRQVAKTRRISLVGWFLVALAALRLMRSWNQTGQKYAGEPDIVKIFLLPYPELLWILVAATYGIISFNILASLDGLPYVISTGLSSFLVSAAFSFKLAFTAEDAPELVVGFAKAVYDMFQGQTLLFRARLVFALLSITGVWATYRSIVGGPRASRTSAYLFHYLYSLLALTQSRATNIPILLLSSLIFNFLQSSNLSIPQITTSSILLQHATFFAFGGSNAISSIDLSSAYNGISSFNVIAVGFLTLISNWSGPIFWTSAANLLLMKKAHEGQKDVFRQHITLLTAFTAASIAFVMAACTILRTHLFIWTVFSPKYLYCMAWGLGQHLLINVGFGGLLYWLSSR
ncbi:unnamed protein product [Clonostachys byssicola]|uniref:GPI ethanolamine phosphate transferase 2 n=1 Tax=Clonostachys byssicola TaxID=160290 RepID=A0A9N9UJX5_9HYPO|nr:unnamed protein product [Clonostachys byssicola]